MHAQDDDGSVGTAHWLMRKRNPTRTGAVATRDGVGGRIIAGVFEKHRDKLHQSQQLQRQVYMGFRGHVSLDVFHASCALLSCYW